MRRRVVITGMGIWSCIGQDLDTVSVNLRNGYSGIVSDKSRQAFGLRSSLVGHIPAVNLRPFLNISQRRALPLDVQYAYMASRQALDDALIGEEYLRQNEVGVIVGNDGSMDAAVDIVRTMDRFEDSSLIGPSNYFRWATSSASMNLSSLFHLKGVSLSTGAACASSIHAIGVASLYIRSGLQDTILVGGCADPSKWSTTVADSLAVIAEDNGAPTTVSRPFDAHRSGIVPSGGAAMLVLEEYEHAKSRGARIYAELMGYGCASNALENMSAPDASGELRSMLCALQDSNVSIDEVDCICAHATSTVVGDREEVLAIKQLIGGRDIPVCATKSMTGHENWMAGASETIYSILMMRDGFVAPTINLEQMMPEAEGLNIQRDASVKDVRVVVNNSFGLGGTNGCIVLKKF